MRLALLGDRHQLSAVGRGGVLDLAARWAVPDACLDARCGAPIHPRHRHVDGPHAPDSDYADLTLAMRAGDDPGDVFDALLARNQIASMRAR